MLGGVVRICRTRSSNLTSLSLNRLTLLQGLIAFEAMSFSFIHALAKKLTIPTLITFGVSLDGIPIQAQSTSDDTLGSQIN